MTEAAFNEGRLARRPDSLQQHQQIAFGAACCERILTNYSTFREETNWGYMKPVREALDVVWQAGFPNEQEVQALLAACEAAAPDSEDFNSLYTSSAQDAVFAVCSLLDFLLRGEVTCIVNAERYPTDSIDLFVQERESMHPQDPELERKILEHPLMQQELLRQKHDLEAVQLIEQGDRSALMALSRPASATPSPSSTGFGGSASVRKGQEAVEQIKRDLESEGYTIREEEVTFDTSEGTTRLDLVADDPDGNFTGVECKNGPFAKVSENQEKNFRALEEEGGTPRGPEPRVLDWSPARRWNGSRLKSDKSTQRKT